MRPDRQGWDPGVECYSVVDEANGFAATMGLGVVLDALSLLRQDAPDFLTPAEARQMHRFLADRRAESYLRGRLAAKQVLAAVFGGERRDWQVTPGVMRQPIVSHLRDVKPAVTLSISHCDRGAIALAAPATWPAAVDCELVSPRNADAIAGQMTAAEREAASVQLHLDHVAALTLLWSVKEAASKVLGGGLAIDFNMLETKDLDFTAEGRLSARFVHLAHLQASALCHGDQVLAIVFPASSEILVEGAGLLAAQMSRFLSMSVEPEIARLAS